MKHAIDIHSLFLGKVSTQTREYVTAKNLHRGQIGINFTTSNTLKPTAMKTSFDLLKNGKSASNVWANVATKEIYPANKNSFGFNACHVIGNEFWNKYGRNMKVNQGRHDYTRFYYSAKSMQEVGFQLVKRGENPLW